jgi:hypothetical protein
MQLGGHGDFYILLFGVIIWPVLQWIQQRNIALNVVQISETVQQRPWQLLDKCSGKKA